VDALREVFLGFRGGWLLVGQSSGGGTVGGGSDRCGVWVSFDGFCVWCVYTHNVMALRSTHVMRRDRIPLFWFLAHVDALPLSAAS
jgi:hypothetical protein